MIMFSREIIPKIPSQGQSAKNSGKNSTIELRRNICENFCCNVIMQRRLVVHPLEYLSVDF